MSAIERSVAAQIVIGVLIVAALLVQLITHLPDGSAVRGRARRERATAWSGSAAMESQWGVFAPNPRSTSLKIEGRVTFEDGSTATWHLPDGARIGANLRYYRWRKWLERVRSDDFRTLWEPTCEWIASLYDDVDSPVESVQLVRLLPREPPDRRAAAVRGVRVPHVHAGRGRLVTTPTGFRSGVALVRLLLPASVHRADDARPDRLGSHRVDLGGQPCSPTSTPSSWRGS